MLTATDRGTIRIVVVILGVLALACVGGVIALAFMERGIPDVLATVTGLSVGAFVAMLTKTSSGAGGAEAVAALAQAQAVGIAAPPELAPAPTSTEGAHDADPNLGVGL